MEKLLNDFRPRFRERLLGILWRQWTALGVSGHGVPWEGSVIDPEALLIFSCTVARHEPRLFDAMTEWMRISSRFVSVQRIKRMLKDESFAGEAALQAVAAVAKTSAHDAKWDRLIDHTAGRHTEKDPLFFLRDGQPVPVLRKEDPVFARYGLLRDRFEARGVAQPFRPEPVSNLLLRLRALLGVNARCEILLFLALNEQGSPRAMARDCYYYPATVAKALAEMDQSGYVVSRVEGRHRYYRLVSELWTDLFIGEVPRPAWIVWARLFGALERIWALLNREGLADRSALAQASLLRRILKQSVVPQLERCGLPLMLGDYSAHPGEALIPFFVERIEAVLDRAEHPDAARPSLRGSGRK